MAKSYEEILRQIKRRNDNLIYNFVGRLRRSGISEKTIKKHEENIDFFLNEFVRYMEVPEGKLVRLCHAEDGIEFVDEFLGDFFIRKAMWSDESSIKSNIASIKKFYQFLKTLSLISNEEYKKLNDTIRNNKETWIKTVNRYNDPSVDFEEIWD